MPPDLSRLVGEGNLAYRWATVGGHRYLVVGAPSRGAELYFFFDEQQLQDDLDQLRVILIGGVARARRVVGPGRHRARAPSAGTRSARPAPRRGRLRRVCSRPGCPAEAPTSSASGRPRSTRWRTRWRRKIDALSLAREREQRFTADVAHELRTPLTALVNEAAILRDQIDRMPPDAQRASRMLTADVTRLSRLVEDLLEISRLDAGAEPVRAEPVDLGLLVRAVLAENGWAGSVAVDVDVPPVVSDRRRLERVIVNLIGNALAPRRRGGRRSPARGRRPPGADRDRSRAGHPGGRAGIGVRQVSKAAEGGGGSGLGLAIAREHASALGGDVRVESRARGRGGLLAVAPCCRTVTRG